MIRQQKLVLIYLLLVMLLLSLAGTAAAAGTPAVAPAPEVGKSPGGVVTPFKDVAGSDSNAIFIKYMAERGLIKGFPDGSYHPGDGLTRAEAATLLVRTAGLPVNTKNVGGYKDLTPDYWAYAYILTANNAGYLTGYPDGSFKPEAKLTRAEGISLFLRLSKQNLSGAALPALGDMDSKHWAAQAVAAALQAGMIGLSQDGKKFYPDQDFRRGDMARALGILLTKDPDLSKASLIGSLKIKNGEVKVTKAGSKEAKIVTSSLDIGEGDLIETGKAGEAELNYSDGSNLLLKADSKLLVKTSQGRSYIKADGTPGVGVDNLEVNMLQGKLFGALATKAEVGASAAGTDKTQEKAAPKTGSLSSRLASLTDRMFLLAAGSQEQPWYQTAEKKKVKVKVDMPWGVAAVRGTFWGNTVTQNSCGTTLLEGSAEVVTPAGTQPLNPGTSSAVTSATAPPSTPVQMSVTQAQEWVAQKEWVQQTAETIQQNQETTPPPPPAADAPTATATGTTPANPTQTTPTVTPVVTPAVDSVLTVVNNALVQVAQSAGISINISNTNTNNNAANNTTTINNNSTSSSGGGGSTTTNTSTSSSSSSSSSTPSPTISGRAAYLQINTVTVANGQLDISGSTLPNQTVTISSPMMAQLSRTTSDATGKFAFTGISVNTSATSSPMSGISTDSVFVSVSPDASGYTSPSASLVITGVLAGSITPALPVKIDLPRLVRYSTGTDLYLNGSVPTGKAYNIIVYYCGLTSPLEGTSNQDTGSFSINVGSVDSGTILYVTVQDPDNATAAVVPVATGMVPVVSLNSLTILGTVPYSGATLDSSTQTLKVIFDRNITASSEYANIALNTSTGSSVTLASGSISISSNTLAVDLPASLTSGQTYTLQVPANAVKALIGTGQNQEIILSFSTPGSTPTTTSVEQLSNAKLNLAIDNSNGRFTLGTTDGTTLLTSDNYKSLIYGWSSSSPSPGSSKTTLQLDGTNYIYGDTSGASEYWEQTPANSTTDTNLSTYCFGGGKVKVQQSLQLVNNQLVMKYNISNTDTVDHSAGLRIMLDTKVGGNDASLFRVNGQAISQWTDYTGSAIPDTWYGVDSQSSPGVVALGQNLLTQTWVPDRFLFGNWGTLRDNYWNCSGSGALGDSGVAMYWNPVSIAAGQSKECTWSFGVIPDNARLVRSATCSLSSLEAGSASTQSIAVGISTLGMAGSTLTASLVNAAGTVVTGPQSTSAIDASGICSATLTVPANISAGSYYINIYDSSTLMLSIPIAAGSTTPTGTAPTITEIPPAAIICGSEAVVPLMGMPEINIAGGTDLYSSLRYQVSPSSATITSLNSSDNSVADFIYTANTSAGITKQLAIINTGTTSLTIAATNDGISVSKSVYLRVVPQYYVYPPNLTAGYGDTPLTVSDVVYGTTSSIWGDIPHASLQLYYACSNTPVPATVISSLPTPTTDSGGCHFTLPSGLPVGSYWLLVVNTTPTTPVPLGIAQFSVGANPAAIVSAIYDSGNLTLTCTGVPSGASFDPAVISIKALDVASGAVSNIHLYDSAGDTFQDYPGLLSSGNYYYNASNNSLTIKVYPNCTSSIVSNIAAGNNLFVIANPAWCLDANSSPATPVGSSMLPLPLLIP